MRNVLRSLNQTRESLSAEESFLEQPGQLLDKALAKQIARREAELDSLSAPPNNSVSVIVTCSTPDPEATCSKDNPASHFPEKPSESFSIPNFFFESLAEIPPPIPPRHPRAPEVPYTPPRNSCIVRSCGTSLLEDFRSPKTSVLLEPLITLGTKEVTVKMPDLNSMKDECVRKLSIFESLLRRYDPTGVPPPLVLKMYDKWDNELSNALNSLTESVSNMTDSQKVGEVVNSWSQHVADSEKKYRDNMCATHAIVAAEEAKRVPSSVSSGPVVAAPVEETLSSARQVRAAEVKVKVEAKRVSAEGKKLDNEVKRYNDWGDASNEEIEEAMSSIEDWRKRLCKIQDRIYLMEENVDLYSLSSVELAASTSMVENLDKEMEIAIRDIKEQDEVRGLYSLSKSKASDVKLPRFSGKPHENFAKFKAEMLRCFK